MIVSHKHQYIFVKTRKAAGTSIEIALSANAGPSDILTGDTPEDERLKIEAGGTPSQNRIVPRDRWAIKEWVRYGLRRPDPLFYSHMPAKDIRRFIGRRVWDAYFTFTVERNPWDLAISAWFWHYHPNPRPSLAEFVNSEVLPYYSNWRIYTHRARLLVDHVIRYDHLEEGLKLVSDRLSLPRPVLVQAKSEFRTDRRPFQDWYDKATRARVARVFQREIDKFEWTFEGDR